MAEPCLLVISTCPDSACAQRIAEHLVNNGHAACVNVVPGVQSIYQWQGRVQKDQELILLIKTTQANYHALEKAIRSIHPYELPEIIAVSIDTGHEPYLQWISGCIPSQ